MSTFFQFKMQLLQNGLHQSQNITAQPCLQISFGVVTEWGDFSCLVKVLMCRKSSLSEKNGGSSDWAASTTSSYNRRTTVAGPQH